MGIIQKVKEHFEKRPEEDKVIETIEEIMDEREERGDDVLVDSEELMLLKNLFKLRDVRAGQIMIPRIDIVGVPLTISFDDIKEIAIRDKFTRLPVYDKSLDNVIGVVHAKDLLCKLLVSEGSVSIQDVMTHNVLYVPASIRALDLLHEMQTKRTQMAIVVDEYGCTSGLITLEDLLEEIVGEIEDEHDALDSPPVLKTIRSGWVADARIPLTELQKVTGNFLTDDDKSADIDTIGGLVFHLAGKIPSIGEVIRHPSGFKFQATQIDSRCIKMVKILKPTHKRVSIKK
ncbi:MAG: hemolysin family protein [Pseudomonadota bacterium]|nr:hemolysin family protein [Pseudomonadota bacterium]